MILKVIAVIFVLFLIYILLFKKSRANAVNNKKNEKNEKITDEMMECPSCKTYISQKEAILSNGEFFCSKECLLKK